ncbi:MAG: Rne/Rng family ribonuclease [Planctomycetota bacterium]
MATKKKSVTTKKIRKTRNTINRAEDPQAGVAPEKPATDHESSLGVKTKRKASKTASVRQKATSKKTVKRTAKTRARPAESKSSRPAVKPLSPNAQIETSEGAVIIRFPPVAPLPFDEVPAPPPPVPTKEQASEQTEILEPEPTPIMLAPAKAKRDPESAHEESPAADETPEETQTAVEEVSPARKKRRRGRRRRSKNVEPAEPAVETPKPVAEEPVPPEEPSLPTNISASKKRRLRRQRRATRDTTGSTEPSELAEPPAAKPEEQQPEPESNGEQAVVADVEPTEKPDTKKPVTEKFDTEKPALKKNKRRRRGRGGRRDDQPAAPKAEAPPVKPAARKTDEVLTKEMIINVVPGEECRIAILHQGKLEEIYIERASSENHVGNIYKGVVTNVESSIQAAFVDFGLDKNGFLHISDLHPKYFPNGGSATENVGRKMPRRNRPPIQRCLKRGQHVIVQITKEGIGTKGPTLSTYASIPGRYVVMMPGMSRLGVSRRIEDEDTRIKLRNHLAELDLPADVGFIARTAAQGRTKRELQSDLKYLTRLWKTVEQRIKNEQAPAELYRESDLVIRTIRDLYTTDIGRIVVDDVAMAKHAREFLHIFSPRSGDVVQEYDSPEPIFHKRRIEAELNSLHSRHVPLKSGGSLVIDQTEALVAIDVNSGRFRAEDDAETTAFKINMEAADEVARQLRLRDLGGVIICDFIDMRQESHKRDIERCLIRQLKEHKERAKILRMSAFGIIEMTRQRQRASLTRNAYQDCQHCHGTGLIKTPESVILDVMRNIQLNVIREQVQLIEATVSSEVGLLLLNRKRAQLNKLETTNQRTISIKINPNYGLDQVEVRCWDQRGRLVPNA